MAKPRVDSKSLVSQISMGFTAAQKSWLKREAKRQKTTMSALVRAWIEKERASGKKESRRKAS